MRLDGMSFLTIDPNLVIIFMQYINHAVGRLEKQSNQNWSKAMSGKKYKYIVFIGGIICAFVFIRHIIIVQTRPLRSDVIQGVIVGFGLAIATAQIIAELKTSKFNGWTIMYGLGKPDNGMFMRAACAIAFPGPVNSPHEAVYWKTSVDGANRNLTGELDYIMRFPSGGLPPNKAFWSLTMGDADNRFVENSINRYSVGDRSDLVPNSDGSIDIYIQKQAPPGDYAPNWLPAPPGRFNLWLRVYMPDAVILDGKYSVPPVSEAKS